MTFINRIIKASAIAGTGLLFATGALAGYRRLLKNLMINFDRPYSANGRQIDWAASPRMSQRGLIIEGTACGSTFHPTLIPLAGLASADLKALSTLTFVFGRCSSMAAESCWKRITSEEKLRLTSRVLGAHGAA